MELRLTLNRLHRSCRRCSVRTVSLAFLLWLATWSVTWAETAPAWAQQISPGTWAQVGLNTLADVDPQKDSSLNPNFPNNAPWHAVEGQSGVLQDWTGGALASRYGSHGALLVFGGGHNGYFGSEVYAFDLGTQLWKRITDPYRGPFNWPYTSTTFPNNSPVPTHTYDFVDYQPGTNSFVVMRSIRDGVGPTENSDEARTHLLDLDTGKWRSSQRNNGLSLHDGGSSCYDSNRDVFWIMGPYSSRMFAKFNPNVTNNDGTVGSYTNYTGDNVDIDTAAACDPVHDIYVYTEFRKTDKIYARNLKDPSAARVTLKESGDIPPSKDHGNGWEWSPNRQAFIYWRRGGDVYEFKLVDGSWDTGTWRWTKLTSSGNSTIPQNMYTDNGVYSRFRVAHYDDLEVAVVVNRIDGPVYAFRLPDGTASTSAPTVTLGATPRNITSGQASTLQWSASNAASCTASGGWTGSKPLAGTQQTSGLTASTTYSLECTGTNGIKTKASVTVMVAGQNASQPENAAPLLYGAPAGDVAVGTLYSFRPNASDSDGDTLTFSIANKPAWAAFNTSTGVLSGTPGTGDVGTTSGIKISVTDGTASASLASFAITVQSPGNLSGTLSWTPPTTDAYGNALSNLAGYNIYYGPQSGTYSTTIRLSNPGLTRYTIEGLQAGTYYFAVSALSANGIESDLSDEVVGTLRAKPLAEPTSPASGGSPSGSGNGTPGTDNGDPETGTTDTAGNSSSGISAIGPAEVSFLLLCLVLGMRRKMRIRQHSSPDRQNTPMHGAFLMSRTTPIAILSVVLVAASSLAHADDADFQARCSAPGVLVCVGFDTPAEMASGKNLFPAWDGKIRGTADTTIKASGASSLRFEVPAFSDANTSGYALWDMGQAFGPGSTFYVQFRERFSPVMLNTRFKSDGWKQIIIHRAGSSCGNVELTTQNVYSRGFPIMYTDCGARTLQDNLGGGDYMLQQGDYQCRYSSRPAGCATYKPDQWMTFAYRVHVGDWGTATSSIQAWVGYEGEPLKQWINQNNFVLKYGDSPSDTFSKIQLTPYQSKKDNTQDHPVGYVWYDELIVSTQPIAGPNGTTPEPSTPANPPPAPPTDLSFQ